MSNLTLEQALKKEYSWRESELITIKQLSISSRLSEKQRKVVVKYAIANIYAIWEGFVKDTLKIYIKEINALELTARQLHPNLLAHSIDTKLPQITTGIQTNFLGKKDFITSLISFLDNTIILEDKLPTESNLNFKVINEILPRFNLETLPEVPFKSYLNDILNFRNKASHGEDVSFITPATVQVSADNIRTLMEEIMSRILQGFADKTYKI